jgi:HPt (histidine-containing phosphotransfer) domain-containing protein
MSDEPRHGIHKTIDAEALLAQLDGDAATMRELLALYTGEAPELQAAIRTAVGANNSEALRRAAHALKGTLASITATRASAAAERLEALARGGTLAHAAALLAELEQELEHLRLALEPLLTEDHSP